MFFTALLPATDGTGTPAAVCVLRVRQRGEAGKNLHGVWWARRRR